MLENNNDDYSQESTRSSSASSASSGQSPQDEFKDMEDLIGKAIDDIGDDPNPLSVSSSANAESSNSAESLSKESHSNTASDLYKRASLEADDGSSAEAPSASSSASAEPLDCDYGGILNSYEYYNSLYDSANYQMMAYLSNDSANSSAVSLMQSDSISASDLYSTYTQAYLNEHPSYAASKYAEIAMNSFHQRTHSDCASANVSSEPSSVNSTSSLSSVYMDGYFDGHAAGSSLAEESLTDYVDFITDDLSDCSSNASYYKSVASSCSTELSLNSQSYRILSQSASSKAFSFITSAKVNEFMVNCAKSNSQSAALSAVLDKQRHLSYETSASASAVCSSASSAVAKAHSDYQIQTSANYLATFEGVEKDLERAGQALSYAQTVINIEGYVRNHHSRYFINQSEDKISLRLLIEQGILHPVKRNQFLVDTKDLVNEFVPLELGTFLYIQRHTNTFGLNKFVTAVVAKQMLSTRFYRKFEADLSTRLLSIQENMEGLMQSDILEFFRIIRRPYYYLEALNHVYERLPKGDEYGVNTAEALIDGMTVDKYRKCISSLLRHARKDGTSLVTSQTVGSAFRKLRKIFSLEDFLNSPRCYVISQRLLYKQRLAIDYYTLNRKLNNLNLIKNIVSLAKMQTD